MCFHGRHEENWYSECSLHIAAWKNGARVEALVYTIPWAKDEVKLANIQQLSSPSSSIRLLAYHVCKDLYLIALNKTAKSLARDHWPQLGINPVTKAWTLLLWHKAWRGVRTRTFQANETKIVFTKLLMVNKSPPILEKHWKWIGEKPNRFKISLRL